MGETPRSLAAIPRAHLPEAPAAPAAWCLGELAGRLAELRGDAAVTLAFRLVLEAQERGEPAAWIAAGACFFPPDAADGGVDLDALLVVRAPDDGAAARAADQLARSGAFGLLVVDAGAESRVPTPLLARLLGLAQKHAIAVLFLTEAPLGSLISLRAEARRTRRDDGGWECEVCALKDKRRAPGWTWREVCRGPAGLR